MNRRTVVRRAMLSGLAAAGLVALGTTSAAAHVTITPSTTAAGATATLLVEIPHGCEGSATTAITLRVPEEVTDVTVTGTDRWAAEQAADALTWTTDEPLPDGELAAVEFSVRLPDDVGATLVFPVVQRCEDGEAAWTEVAEADAAKQDATEPDAAGHDAAGHDEGHDQHEERDEALDRPAPIVVVTAGDTSGESGETEAASATGAPEAASATGGADERDPLIAYGAAGLLAAGVLAGGAVLLRRRRRP